MEKHTSSALIGRGFHKLHNGSAKWQGEVIAEIGGGYYLVQLFEWALGHASTQHVIHVSEFALSDDGGPRFQFFDNLEAANDYAERHSA